MQNRIAIYAAAYMLWLAKKSGDKSVTPMKLQKLLYYAEAFSLAWRGRDLFVEPIESWEHGPVIPSVYEHYKQFKGTTITVDAVEPDGFDAGDITVMKAVWQTYGRHSATTLSEWTHEEMPWKHARNTQMGPTRDALRAYFRTQRHPSCQEGRDQLFAKFATQYMLGMIDAAGVARAMGGQWTESRVRSEFKRQGIVRLVPSKFDVIKSVRNSLGRYAETWKELAQR
jgi:uncharacterized phage-associated protein